MMLDPVTVVAGRGRLAPAWIPGSYVLPRVAYQRLRFFLAARAPALLPEVKGSMLRGAFGGALRRSVCAMGPGQACGTCALRHACTYTRLFETPIEGPPPPFFRGLETAPRPYVLEVEDARRRFLPGDVLAFDLLLFGQVLRLAPYAELAVERLAGRGLGARRFPFELVRQEVGESLELPPEITVRDSGSLTLRFLTPTRLLSRGKLVVRPTPRELVFACLRRLLEVAAFHSPQSAVDWTFRPLLELAQGLRIERQSLRWLDWPRYSNRQQTEMQLGGFVGEMTLAGEITPFLPLFACAEVVHVGKATTFGLGALRLEVS